jgi:hypothetical protein
MSVRGLRAAARMNPKLRHVPNRLQFACRMAGRTADAEHEAQLAASKSK